jgi:hypothetical protein
MTHIAGHLPDGSLYIRDPLIGLEFHVHGYLFVAKPNELKIPVYDPSIRILFFNNQGLDLPQPRQGKITLDDLSQSQIDERMVGFHLKLLDMPDSDMKWAIAYDLVKWQDHQNVEKCMQRTKKYTGKLVEDIDADELSLLADKIGLQDSSVTFILKELKEAKVSIPTAVKILQQSAKYMKTDSFKVTRAGHSQYNWIKQNVVPFEKMASLFGMVGDPVKIESIVA